MRSRVNACPPVPPAGCRGGPTYAGQPRALERVHLPARSVPCPLPARERPPLCWNVMENKLRCTKQTPSPPRTPRDPFAMRGETTHHNAQTGYPKLSTTTILPRSSSPALPRFGHFPCSLRPCAPPLCCRRSLSSPFPPLSLTHLLGKSLSVLPPSLGPGIYTCTAWGACPTGAWGGGTWAVLLWAILNMCCTSTGALRINSCSIRPYSGSVRSLLNV